MDYRAFEQRLLDTIFTTDVQLTPATIAFLYKIQVQEAADLLQQAAVAGLLNIESDDDGNILYIYPNRIKLPPRAGAQTGNKATALAGGGALIRIDIPRSAELRATETSEAALRPAPHDPSRELALRPVAHDPSREADFDRLPSISVEALPADGGAASRQGAVYMGEPERRGADAHGHGGTTRCPFCSEQIVIGAKKCRHCHEYLDYALRDIHSRQGVNQVSVSLQPINHQTALTQWTGTQAALLSLVMPGLGQMCSGRVPAGLLWMMFTIMGYLCFIVPGFILHVLCVINASRMPRQAT